MAEPGVQDLARVGGAHGAHLVGRFHRSLHKVGAAVVLHNMGVPLANAAGVLQNIQPVFALVLDIMDGEHRLNAAVFVQMPVVKVQIHRHQRRLPVVGVQHVRHKIGVKQHFQNSPAEKRKPLAIVVKAVQAAALKIIFVVEKIERHAVALGGKQAAVLAAPAHRHAEAGHIFQLIPVFQIAVERQHHPAVHPVSHKGLGQASGNVAKAAGRGVGVCLAGTKKNVHSFPP